MKYGLEIAAAGECGHPRGLAELAGIAEEAGWDGVFLEDYIVHWQDDAPTYDPWICLAAMALATERIRIGTTVTPLPRRRPWKLAREAVTIDHLSRGRFTLGVGIGGLDDVANFEHFGEASDARHRAAMLDEGLDILAGLWSGEPFSYHGVYYTVTETRFLPTPVQQPRIPVWVGGSARKAGPVRRAARWDGVVPVPVSLDSGGSRYLTPDELQGLRETIERERGVDGSFDIAIGGLARSSDWAKDRAQMASLAGAGCTWWLEWIPAADPATMRAAIERGPVRIE